jgi:Tfp pilus assembly protein FimT
MSSLPLVPITAILVVFGLPYLIIFLQSKRLAAMEESLKDLTNQVSLLRTSLGKGDAPNA